MVAGIFWVLHWSNTKWLFPLVSHGLVETQERRWGGRIKRATSGFYSFAGDKFHKLLSLSTALKEAGSFLFFCKTLIFR